MGEFNIESTMECPECFDSDDIDSCELCDGGREIPTHKIIPWDKIKDIYKAVVRGVKEGKIKNL